MCCRFIRIIWLGPRLWSVADREARNHTESEGTDRAKPEHTDQKQMLSELRPSGWHRGGERMVMRTPQANRPSATYTRTQMAGRHAIPFRMLMVESEC